MNDYLTQVFNNELISKIIITIGLILIALFIIGIIRLINAIAKKYNFIINDQDFYKCLDFIKQAIYNSVQATNQTFVDNLKAKGLFTSDKQKEAFNITFNSVKTICESYIKHIFPNLSEEAINTFITNLIEEAVKTTKTEKVCSTIDLNSLYDENPEDYNIELYTDVDTDLNNAYIYEGK